MMSTRPGDKFDVGFKNAISTMRGTEINAICRYYALRTILDIYETTEDGEKTSNEIDHRLLTV